MNQTLEYWTRQIVRAALGGLATYTGIATLSDPTFVSLVVTIVSAIVSLAIPELWANLARKKGRKV